MKLQKNQILSIVAAVLSVTSLAITTLKPETVTLSEKLEFLSNEIKHLQEQQLSNPQIQQTTTSQKNFVESTSWESHDPSDQTPYYNDAWSYKGYDQTYMIKLGDPDPDGEIRYLLMRDEQGVVKKVGLLPKNLTYIQLFGEADGSPINYSPARLSREVNTAFRIEVYEATPINGFDYRLPVLVKYIWPE